MCALYKNPDVKYNWILDTRMSWLWVLANHPGTLNNLEASCSFELLFFVGFVVQLSGKYVRNIAK